jgi:hypothetical protein
MKKLLLAGTCLFTVATQAQLTVTDSLSVSSIATLLEGLNVSVSNVTVNCPEAAMGHFVGTSELAITEGLVLTSGSADEVAGTSAEFASAGIMGAGDADLEADLGGGLPTYDACALEFDCVPYGDTLLFNFSFGSEEYQEFVGSSFNDAFAIYITGPGFLTSTNVAAIPGGTLVSINNVNSGINNAYYYDNEFPIPGQYVEYDGFTTNLTTFAVVQPGETYHFKVVVADVADGAFDSGVFLEAFSFRSPMLTTAVTEAPADVIHLIQRNDEVLMQLPAEAAHGQQVLVIDAAGRVVQQSAVTGSTTVLSTVALGEGMYVVQVVGSELAPARFVNN